MLRTARLLPLTGLSTLGFDAGGFPTDPASLLPGLLTATRTGLSPASNNELTTGDHSTTRSTSSLLDAQWNKIEHRLFSQVTRNWRGRPLETYQTIVNLIANTTTTTGLTVRCELDPNLYPTKIKITDQQKKTIPFTRHLFHGDWNYTITTQDE